MKCHAGVEFPSGKPCPQCNAKLGEVCWPGINADLLEVVQLRKDNERLRKGIQDFLDGDYINPRKYRYEPGDGKCHHGRYWYEECGRCDENHFASLLSSQERQSNG